MTAPYRTSEASLRAEVERRPFSLRGAGDVLVGAPLLCRGITSVVVPPSPLDCMIDDAAARRILAFVRRVPVDGGGR